jgi:hypothetical protein
MNRVERRVRDLINPYSTAFASWWCHSARYWRLPRVITGNKAGPRPGPPGSRFGVWAAEQQRVRVPSPLRLSPRRRTLASGCRV